MKTWKADRYIWRMIDGSYKSQETQEPRPAMAVELAAKKGEEVSADVATRNGWIDLDNKVKIGEGSAS